MRPAKHYRRSLASWACRYALWAVGADTAYLYARLAARQAEAMHLALAYQFHPSDPARLPR